MEFLDEGKFLRFDARFGRKALENDVSDVESPKKFPPAAGNIDKHQ